MKRYFHHSLFIFRFRYLNNFSGKMRKLFLSCFGMNIGKGTFLPKLYITWPHQVSIGKNCNLEHGIYFKYDGIWSKGPSIIIDDNVFIGSTCEFNINCGIKIGSYSNIASGCRFVDHDHGIKSGLPIGGQASVKKEIILEEDVWLGCNVVILKGVNIGKGAIVGAGAVVTQSIPSQEIWGGVPARFIAKRK